jgi:tRNA U34 5-carboxymethylaminomethyl modifying GTPase MnmE/TrmE
MEIVGTVTQVFPVVSGQSKAGKTWQKQGFTIETDGDYPKSVYMEAFGDKVEVPGVGQRINAHINIESREYNGKWYTNVSPWRVDVLEANAPVQAEAEFADDDDGLPW